MSSLNILNTVAFLFWNQMKIGRHLTVCVDVLLFHVGNIEKFCHLICHAKSWQFRFWRPPQKWSISASRALSFRKLFEFSSDSKSMNSSSLKSNWLVFQPRTGRKFRLELTGWSFTATEKFVWKPKCILCFQYVSIRTQSPNAKLKIWHVRSQYCLGDSPSSVGPVHPDSRGSRCWKKALLAAPFYLL